MPEPLLSGHKSADFFEEWIDSYYARLAFYQGTALEPLLHPINVDGTISVEKEPGRGRPGVGMGK